MENIFQYYNHLGFFNPYFIENKLPYQFKSQISDILKFKKDRNVLNSASVANILTKGFIIGDNTLVRNIKKTPWLTKYGESGWDYYQEIRAQEKFIEKEIIVEEIFTLLKEELIEYIGEKKNVGILLSGGMDSRIVAGVLDFLIKKGILANINVTAYTWGDLTSRDVNYGRNIAHHLSWNWKHFNISAEDVMDNILTAAFKGCEYSPFHLHGMVKVSKEIGVDCVLAGSYGDSIGRGEYSGKKVLQLRDIRYNMTNNYGLIKDEIFTKCKIETDAEIHKYSKLFPQEKTYQQIEQDYQIHYMRRMLNPCMAVINEKIELYQLFTSPKIVSYIWSLHPKLRNNHLYHGILKKIDPKLSEIPWARTGLIFDRVSGVPQDNYLRSPVSNLYVKIFKDELFENIKTLVLSEPIKSLEIFNLNALKNAFSAMKYTIYKDNIELMSKMAWLASLALFVQKYDVQFDSSYKIGQRFADKFGGYKVYIENGKYSLITIYRQKLIRK